MWYFRRILGTGLALALGALRPFWFEVTQSPRAPVPPGNPRPDAH